jgi:hypothetical protein
MIALTFARATATAAATDAGRPAAVARPSLPARLAARAWVGDRTLVVFGLVMVALAAVALAGLALDPRTLRGVGVWVKPAKFALSLAVLAWTTAIVAGFLDAAFRRRSRSLAALRGVFVFTATFEILYITFKAALGEASHFNRSDAFHDTLYSLMGVAALALAATQPWLAVLLARHPAPGLHPALRQAMGLGLWLSFALGAGAGVMMGGGAPPLNGGIPVLGWTFGTGDLRPAHFVGMHAAQALPLVAAWMVARRWPRATGLVRIAAAGWVLLFAAAVAAAFAGAVSG